MRTLVKYLFQYVMAVVFIFACLTAWIIFDGLHDQGEKADAALVMYPPPNQTGLKDASERDGLDRAVKLFKDGDISFIIVASSTSGSGDETDAMAQYLESKGISSDVIVENHQWRELEPMGREVADILKARDSQSIIIVAPYYEIDPIKIALIHENLRQIGKAHVGTLRKEDLIDIGRGVVELCQFVGTFYVLPAAEKAKEETQAGLAKATVEAQQARDNMDKKLNSMSK